MRLFDYAVNQFHRIRAVVKGRSMATVPIRERAGAQLDLVAGRTVRRIVRRGHRRDVKIAVHAPDSVAGPIYRGQKLGTIDVTQGGRRVATVPLVAATHVPPAGLAQQTKNLAAAPLVLIGVAIA